MCLYIFSEHGYLGPSHVRVASHIVFVMKRAKDNDFTVMASTVLTSILFENIFLWSVFNSSIKYWIKITPLKIQGFNVLEIPFPALDFTITYLCKLSSLNSILGPMLFGGNYCRAVNSLRIDFLLIIDRNESQRWYFLLM